MCKPLDPISSTTKEKKKMEEEGESGFREEDGICNQNGRNTFGMERDQSSKAQIINVWKRKQYWQQIFERGRSEKMYPEANCSISRNEVTQTSGGEGRSRLAFLERSEFPVWTYKAQELGSLCAQRPRCDHLTIYWAPAIGQVLIFLISLRPHQCTWQTRKVNSEILSHLPNMCLISNRISPTQRSFHTAMSVCYP